MSEQHSSTQHSLKKLVRPPPFIFYYFNFLLFVCPSAVSACVAEDCCGNIRVVVSSACDLTDREEKTQINTSKPQKSWNESTTPRH